MSLPIITVVTPSYNQGAFLERTIRSVLGQDYPRLEYIVMDGGSTDGSREIIERYSPWLSYWKYGPDDGQAGAVLDGFSRASGGVLAYVNSDDVLMEGTLWQVGRYFGRPDALEVIVGDALVIDAVDAILGFNWTIPPVQSCLLHFGCTFTQCSSFWTRSAFERVGGFRRDFRFSFDFDLFVRLCRNLEVAYLPGFLSAVREHAATKTSTLQGVRLREDAIVRAREGVDGGEGLRRGLRYYRWLVEAASLKRLRNWERHVAPGQEASEWQRWLRKLRASDSPLW